MSKFLVYWSDDDIDDNVRCISRDVEGRVTRDRGSGIVAGVISGPSIACSEAVTRAFSKTGGCHMYYQHLLSARSSRDALEGHSDGIGHDMANFALSVVGNVGRITKTFISS